MNVNDFPNVETVPAAKQLEYIFATQRSLLQKYLDIEVTNGFPAVSVPVNIHDKFGQHHLKDLAWRVMEEVGEALEAMDIHDNVGHEHVHEELADGLHFIIELCIMAGMEYPVLEVMLIARNQDLFSDSFCEIVPLQLLSQGHYELRGFTSAGIPLVSVAVLTRELGRAMNCLKNKPWKQTHQLTDEPRFMRAIYLSLVAYLTMMHEFGLNSQDIFNIYFRKSKVNEFRQKSNY